MADPQPSTEAETELDPAAERVRRKLVRFMAINLGILFAALMAVVIAIVYRAFWNPPEDAAVADVPAELAAPPPDGMLTGEIALPDGARLLSHSLSGERLTFDVEIGDERQILVYDIATGRMIGRFSLGGLR